MHHHSKINGTPKDVKSGQVNIFEGTIYFAGDGTQNYIIGTQNYIILNMKKY